MATAKTPRWISVKDYLVGVAAESVAPVTYGQVSTALRWGQGVPARRDHLAGMLRRVSNWCDLNGLPDATAWVVSIKTGQPGSQWAGWSTGADPDEVRRTAHPVFRRMVWHM